MVADIRVGGELFQRVESYQVTEDSSPVSAADATGGYGAISFTTVGSARDRELVGASVVLEDPRYGATSGTVGPLGATGDLVTLSGDSRLSQMMTDRQALPYTGTLEGYFRYCFGLVGLTGGISVSEKIASRSVTFGGWYGNVWHHVNKQLCPALGVEIALVSNNIIVRPLRQLTADRTRESSMDWSFDEGQLAQSVEVSYYPTVYHESGPAYPFGGWHPGLSIISAGSSEMIEVEVEMGGPSLISVQQPVAVAHVARYHSVSSVYSVLDKDGKQVDPAEWTADGGRVEVEVLEDTTSLLIRVHGASRQDRAPYQIAALGEVEPYSSLRIVGTGTFSETHSVVIHTAADPDRVSRTSSPRVDNPFITSTQAAFQAGTWVAKDYAAPRYRLSIDAIAINRPGETGDQSLPSFGDFDSEYGNITFGQFDALWPAGAKFSDFDAAWAARVADRFENQAFGNIGGARIYENGNWFRVRTSTISPDGVSIDAEEDNTFADFDAAWGPSMTFGEFDAANEAKTFGEFDLSPLKGTK